MSTFGTLDTDDNGSDSLSSRTVAWIIIPIIVIIFIVLTATIIQLRRRRQRRQQLWYGTPETMRTVSPTGRVVITRRGRNNTERRAEEGLNELGEAPPPYSGKKENQQDGTELRDAEAADPAPEYPAEPSPVLTAQNSRPRHV